MADLNSRKEWVTLNDDSHNFVVWQYRPIYMCMYTLAYLMFEET